MNLLQSITLGIVQGLTEFLPISSTAHLLLVPKLLGWKDPGAPASAVIQLGTVVAVIAYFARDLAKMVKALLGTLKPGGDRTSPEARLALAVVIGTVPICIAALLLKDLIENTFRDPMVIAVTLIAMAVALFVADRFVPKRRALEDVTLKDGLIVGFAQMIALIPGASRSGSTLTGAFLTGLDRKAALRFSFLLSVPATAIAGLYQLKDFIKPDPISPAEAAKFMVWTTPDILIATVIAGVVGYACVHWLLKFLQKYPADIFVAYRILLGVALLYMISNGLLTR